MFIISCSGGEKEKKKVASTNDEKKTVTTAGPELERTEVRWMYLDDSLRNICRPLNFILPWMASDERELPDTIYHEITRLPPFKYFAPLSFDKNNINDTLVSYSIKMNNSICDCEVIRYYEGDKNNKNFDGYRITEQVICNATSANYDLLNDTNDYSSDKVAEHGHDH